MASCATSVMSVLSSTATEKAIKAYTLFFNWLSKSTERLEILTAMMFLVRLIFAKVFQGTPTSAAFTMHVFMNSPSLNSFEATAMSLAVK